LFPPFKGDSRGLTPLIPFLYVVNIMTRTTEIAEGIYRIETPLKIMRFQPTAFLIKNADALIEPGPAICIPPLHRALEHLGINKLQYIIPTHIHMDHAGGTGTLAKLYPEAKVLVHPRGLKHAIDPSRLIDSVKMVWGENFEKNFGPITAVPESQIKTVHDGEVIHTGDRNLQFIYTPGHAPHHIAIFDHKLKGLFCGEALGMPGYQLPTAAPMSFDLENYLSTIDKLQHSDLDIKMLIYSHGGIERDQGKCMSRASENARDLGDIVLQALGQGEKRAAIGKAVGDYIKKHYAGDMKTDDQGYETIASGYITYFEKKMKP
jgi:glyoxylase-like metal-dependent hydrolase (beta-lactamase superfamily II)